MWQVCIGKGKIMHIDLLKSMKFNSLFDSNQEREKVLKSAANDSLITGKRAIPLIALFEVIMIILLFIQNERFSGVESVAYFACYSSLLLVSIIVYRALIFIQKDIDNRYQYVEGFSLIYVGFLILWAVSITTLDTHHNGIFSGLVFITILVIIPIVSFLKPIQYTLFHAAGCVTVVCIVFLFDKEHTYENTINFTVFALISLISGLSYYGTKISYYKRQIVMKDASERDALSGLYNRQKLNKMAAVLWKECIEEQASMTCILCDIDDFKLINDNYGHLVGDEWIRIVAEIIRESLNDNGKSCFRYGGEEFMIILSGKTMEEGCELTRMIQAKMKALQDKPGNIEITLSFGIYEGMPNQESSNFEKFFSKADALMYQAKRNGKNQYCAEKMQYKFG